VTAYLIRRCLLMIPTLLGITIVVFAVMAAAPGGISAQSLIEGNLEPEARQALESYYNERYGLDQPLPQQYLRWLGKLLPFDFSATTTAAGLAPPDLGTSFLYGRPVLDLIAERLPVTLLLNFLSLPLVFGFAIVLGVQAASRRGQTFDVVAGTSLLALWSIPVMLAGVLLIGFLANQQYWHWFPESGLNRREALLMPFLPHWQNGWQVGLTLLTLFSGAALALFCDRHARAGAAIALWAVVGFCCGIGLSESSGQPLSDVQHLSLTVFVTLSIAMVAWAGTAVRTVLAMLTGATIGLLLLHHYVDIEYTRGFLFDRLWHLILPVICLSFSGLAYLSKLTRSAILENLAADFARTAFAKGADASTVLWRHVFRNSLIPLITVAAAKGEIVNWCCR